MTRIAIPPARRVSRALRARSAPGVSPRVSPENGGCPRECPTGCPRALRGPRLRSVQKASRECPQSVRDTFLALRGHSRDTFLLCVLSRKKLVNIFFVVAWEFCIEKWRGFLVNFFWSPFPTKRSTKTPQNKFGENSERNSGQTPGQKFEEKFGELSFCDFSDLEALLGHSGAPGAPGRAPEGPERLLLLAGRRDRKTRKRQPGFCGGGSPRGWC